MAASLCAITLSGVASLDGTPAERQRDGAIMLTILVVLTLAAAFLTARAASAEQRGTKRQGTLPRARRLAVVTGAAALLCFAALIAGGLLESADNSERAIAGRLPLRVGQLAALRVLARRAQRLRGRPARRGRLGWLPGRLAEERTVEASASKVHSLTLERTASWGCPGLLFLCLFLGGVPRRPRGGR